MKELNRQMAWYFDHKKRGLCVICTKPSNGYARCDDCREKLRQARGSKRRNRPRKRT